MSEVGESIEKPVEKLVERKPFKKRLIKSIAIGIGKGAVYYVGYIVLSYIISYYLIPALLAAYAPSVSAEEVAGEYVSFTLIDFSALAFFLGIGLIGQLCRDLIPYGFIIESLLGLVILYYILSTVLNFGVFDKYLEDMDVYVHMDMSPFIIKMFYVFIVLTIASILGGIAKEYRERAAIKTRSTSSEVQK